MLRFLLLLGIQALLGSQAIPSDDTFIIDFHTDIKNVTGGAGTISVLLNRSLAPLGVDHVRGSHMSCPSCLVLFLAFAAA